MIPSTEFIMIAALALLAEVSLATSNLPGDYKEGDTVYSLRTAKGTPIVIGMEGRVVGPVKDDPERLCVQFEPDHSKKISVGDKVLVMRTGTGSEATDWISAHQGNVLEVKSGRYRIQVGNKIGWRSADRVKLEATRWDMKPTDISVTKQDSSEVAAASPKAGAAETVIHHTDFDDKKYTGKLREILNTSNALSQPTEALDDVPSSESDEDKEMPSNTGIGNEVRRRLGAQRPSDSPVMLDLLEHCYLSGFKHDE